MNAIMKKPKFVLRKTVNRTVGHGAPREHVTWDIMRKYGDGEEFICEFGEKFRKLAAKAVKALNETK